LSVAPTAAPTTNAAAAPTADGQEAAARAQPDGEAKGAASHREPPTASPANEPPEPPEAPDTLAPIKKLPPSRSARGGLLALAALACVLLIAGVGILVLEWDAVTAAGSRLATLISLKEPLGAGLDIGAVTSVREEAADGETLVVQGTVTNLTDQPRPLPGIRVSLFDTDDTELQHVVVVPDREMLAAGETIAFSARLAQPAPTARRIKVTFAARSASD
jgi:hypothetical protein